MSKRDEELAKKYRAKGKISASEEARRKAQERADKRARKEEKRRSGGAMSVRDAMEVMRKGPRDEASLRRARSHRRNSSDGDGGESFADRSTRGFARRFMK